MVLFPGGKKPGLIPAFYLAIMIIGGCAFAEPGSLHRRGFGDDGPFSEAFITPVNETVERLVEGGALSGRAGAVYAHFPFRSGSPRVAAYPGTRYNRVTPVQSSSKPAEKTHNNGIETRITLKLRI
jgi:hypothetical protein